MSSADADALGRRARASRVLAAHLADLPRGVAVDLEDLCRREPDLAPELRRLTAHFEQVDGVVTALLEGIGIGERLASRYGADVDPGISLDEPPEPGPDRGPASTGTPSGTVRRLEARAPVHDRYASKREIARGGMGAILEVWDHDLRRTLAMKVALTRGGAAEAASDERLLSRFLEEAQVTAQLDHPGILPVHELGLDETGRVFFTMPLVKGRDLAQVLDLVRAGEEGWNVTRALNVVLKVCDAMAYAHSKQVIHRDLKPANIMVGRFGEVYVMDWGLAKVLGRRDRHDLRLREAEDPARSIVRTERVQLGGDSPLMTMDGDVVGTPSYMSPEQARGDLEAMGPASDVYSIGCILYHLLAGHMPYVSPGMKINAFAVWGLVQAGPPAPLAKEAKGAPEELIAICEKAMSRDLATRYVDTVELAEDLRAYLEGRVVRAYATGAWPELRKWVGRNRALALTGLAALLAVAGGLALAGWMQLRWQGELDDKGQELDELWKRYDDRGQEIAVMETEANRKREEARELQQSAERDREQVTALQAELGAQRSELEDRKREIARASDEAERQTYVANMTGAAMNLEAGNFDELYRRLEACPPRLRGWEWRHLSLGQNPSLFRVPGGAWTTLLTDQGRIHESTLDGRLVVMDDSGHEEFAWRVNDVWGVAAMAQVGPRRVLYGELGGGLRLVDEADGSLEASWSTGAREVSSLAVTADRTAVLVGIGYRYQRQFTGVLSLTDQEPGALAVWSLPDGRELCRVDDAHASAVRAVVLHPDGERVFSSGTDRAVVEWRLHRGPDGTTLERVRELEGTNAIQAFAIDPAGEHLLGASRDRSVAVWSLAHEVPELTGKLTGHDAPVLDVAVTPDGRRAVTGSEDGTVRVWDLDSFEELSMLRGHDGSVSCVSLSPDGRRILSSSPEDGLRGWDANTSDAITVLSRLDHRLERLSLAYTDRQGGTPAAVWRVDLDRDDGLPALILDEQSVATADGRWLAHRGRKRRLRHEYTIDLWDTGSGALLRTLSGHEDRIRCLAWSPDGTRLASGAEDKTLRLWSAGTGEQVALLGPLDSSVESAAFDPTGRRLAFGLGDGRIYLVEVDASGALSTPREVGLQHDGAVKALAWDATGSHLASGSADDTVLVCGVGPEGVLPLHGRLQGHGGDVLCLAFHPDGLRLFSGSEDGSVRVWDVETGLSLIALSGPRYPVARLAFERDGRRLVTAETVQQPPIVRVWDSDLRDAQDMWQEGEWGRRALALVSHLFERLDGPDAVRAAVLEADVEPRVRDIALRVLERGRED